jgi:hypothetical protein
MEKRSSSKSKTTKSASKKSVSKRAVTKKSSTKKSSSKSVSISKQKREIRGGKMESNFGDGNTGGALGLDVGTSRIVLAEGQGTNQVNSQLNAFVTVPYTKMAESMLQQNRMTFYRNSNELFVYGNDSEKFASFFNTVPRRPMQHGVLNAHEIMGIKMIQAIIGHIMARANKGDIVCFSVPGRGEGTDTNLVYHESVLKGYLDSLGFDARPVNEGLAIVFSELQNESFTGIGISCGGGMCNVCVSFLSVPMLTFSIPKGGDYIDTNVATVVGETSTSVRLFKEQSLDLSRDPKDKMSEALHIYYRDVLQSLITALRDAFDKSGQLPKIERSIPIVLSGGTAKPNGFLQKFEQILKENNFPIPISEIRLAKDPLTATAHGCYIAALSETK